MKQVKELISLHNPQFNHQLRLAMLGELFTEISHEISNLLLIIKGNLPLLNSYHKSEEQFNSTMQSICDALDRAETIIKEVNKFSRISSENNNYQDENLTNIICDSLLLIEPKLRLNAISVLTDFEPDLRISCDIMEIEQVLLNLINNSIYALQSSEIKWLKLRTFLENNNIILQITDSGKGITKSIENKIFQPFFTTKPLGEGTGLGLSIVKKILQRHHASIALNRKISNSCFEIRFPKASY